MIQEPNSIETVLQLVHTTTLKPLSIFILQDSEVLRAWLTDLRFEEYYDKFMTAGYDMPTISRMTPEDLNAIGITKPAHRKKLKAEITRLNISDGLPDFIPVREPFTVLCSDI